MLDNSLDMFLTTRIDSRVARLADKVDNIEFLNDEQWHTIAAQDDNVKFLNNKRVELTIELEKMNEKLNKCTELLEIMAKYMLEISKESKKRLNVQEEIIDKLTKELQVLKLN